MNWLVGAIVLALIGGFGAYIRTSVVSRTTTVKKHDVDIETLKLEQKHLKNSLDEIKEHAINSEDVRRIVKEENEPLHADMRDIKVSQTELKQLFQNAMLQMAENRGYNKAKRGDD